jgi:hypothetical protein
MTMVPFLMLAANFPAPTFIFRPLESRLPFRHTTSKVNGNGTSFRLHSSLIGDVWLSLGHV